MRAFICCYEGLVSATTYYREWPIIRSSYITGLGNNRKILPVKIFRLKQAWFTYQFQSHIYTSTQGSKLSVVASANMRESSSSMSMLRGKFHGMLRRRLSSSAAPLHRLVHKCTATFTRLMTLLAHQLSGSIQVTWHRYIHDDASSSFAPVGTVCFGSKK